MSSLLDFVDFGSTFFGSSGKKEELTRKEYTSQNVDFYKEGLGNVGIKVTDPDRWSDDDEPKRDIDVTKVGVSDGENVLTGTDITNLGTGFQETLSSGSSLDQIQSSFIDYNTSLQEAGFKDRTDSPMYKSFGLATAAVPQSAKEVKKDLSLKNILSPKTAVQALGKLTGLSPATNVLAGAIGGTTLKDPLGNPSFRPSHAVMGLAFDANMSIQSSNIQQSIQAMNANNLTGYGGAKSPTGFFGYVGGQLVSRAPNGRTYSGVNAEYGRMAEAFSKGYAPTGYNTSTETGTTSIAVSTGGFRGYTEKGSIAYGNQTAPAGSMKDVEATGSKYGISNKEVISALEKVRSQYDFLGRVKNSVKNPITLSQALAEKASSGDYTKGSDLGDAAGSVGSTGDLGGATGAGYSTPSNVASASSFGDNNSSDDSSSGGDSGSMGDVGGDGGYATAKGGKVGNGFALGGKAEPAGFIGGPPENYSDQTTIADDIPLKVKDGTFVINAPAVEYAGSIDIQKMLAEGYQKAMTRDIGVDKNFRVGKIPSREELDIQISRGEVVVPPHVAKAIGYDRLEKINNRGKREVERRQKAGNQEKVQAGEGFASKGGEQKVTLYRGEPSKIPKRAALLQDKYTGSWFSPNKNFTKTYGEVAKTMELTFDEYKKGAKKAFLKKNIARHMTEKEESKLPKNLTKNEKSRIFQSLKYIDYMANEVKRGNRSIKAFTDFMYEGVFPKEKDKATIMLLETANRSPKAFGKLVVDSLVKNVVSKGLPILGTVAGFAPTEMGDATLSGEEGFIYDYTPIKNPSATQ
jgi:hypothetical protein